MNIKQTYKIFPYTKLIDLIIETPSLLLMMEHFNINYVVQNKTIEQICLENNLNTDIFIALTELYCNNIVNNGLNCKEFSSSEILTIINFLENTHKYYLTEKYQEIISLIEQVFKNNELTEIKLIEQFVNEYFEEVREHLEYEDKIAFPYFIELLNNNKQKTTRKNKYSSEIYLKHHTDIEFKLIELKNLLLKHIPLKNDHSQRRKLILSLFELENDLRIHSLIEETILIPIIKKIENN